MSDLNYLFLMNLHPCLKEFIQVGNTTIQCSEIMHNPITQFGLQMIRGSGSRLITFVEQQMLELPLSIPRQIALCYVIKGIFQHLRRFLFYCNYKHSSEKSSHLSIILFLQEQIIFDSMEWFYTRIGHFLIGLSDALSPRWIKEVLFYTDRRTKKILNESIQLQIALRRSITQAGIVTTIIPFLVRLMGWEILGWILTGLSLIFTYGYLIFYNMEVTQKAMKVIVYRTQQQAQSMPQLDRRQKYNLFVEMSYLVQSFIFELIFYTPMNLLLIVITMFEVTYSPWILVIMDSFFNAAFYYFRKWPYDKYNVAFLEKQMAYCLGYGFPVSLITNWMLPPSFSIGGYLLISQYMIVNALCHSPPKVTFTSFSQIIEVLRHREKRRQLPSAYNHHRDLLNKDKVYRQKLIQDCLFMSPFFNLTQRINVYVQQKFLNKKFQSEVSQQNPITPQQKFNQQPFQQKKPNLEVIEEQSEEFKVPFAENTTAFQMQFQDEDEKQN